MFLSKFKDAKDIKFGKYIQSYVEKNFNLTDYSQIQTFIDSISATREVISKINIKEKTLDQLKTCKENIVNWLRIVNLLKSKFNFSNDKYSLAIEFSWKDTITNDTFNSYNIHHEYYNCLFNLAIAYYNIANLEKSEEEDKIKESIKNYQYAATIFDTIKQEIDKVILPKEIQPDLGSGFLSYANFYCLAKAQTLIYQVAKMKGLNFQLQATLSRGVFDLYTSALNLATESFKKYFTEEMRVFLNYTRYKYFTESLLRMVDNCENEFKSKGVGYGNMIGYLGLALSAVKEGEKNIEAAKNLINIKSAIDLRLELENKHKMMVEKNQKLYFDTIPQPSALPKIEKLIKANQASLPDDLEKKIDGQECLEGMIPNEVKVLTEKYKSSVIEYINNNLNNYEPDSSLDDFLSKLGLPGSLESAISSDNISESLWQKVFETQKKGGPMFLLNTISSLEKKSEEIGSSIQGLETQLEQEAQEDNTNRTLYLNAWRRQPSENINKNYFQGLFDYKFKLSQAKGCDLMLKESILSNLKNFELINLTRDQLKSKIPVKLDLQFFRELEQTKALQSALENYEKLKENFKDNKKKLIQMMNEENVIGQMIKVLQKKMTEQSVFSENIVKYENIFKIMNEMCPKIKEAKLQIEVANENFFKKKTEFMSSQSKQNETFFQDLELYCKTFNEKCEQVIQGLNFYGDFSRRITVIYQSISDYLMARELEKNEILSRLTGFRPNNNSQNYVGAQNTNNFNPYNPYQNR